jgi:cell division protein FtsW
MGMLGALAVLGLYALIAQRGFRIAATAADDFRALLATGLTLVIVDPGGDHRRRQPRVSCP